MLKLFRILVCAPGILFIFIGLRWAIDPAAAAQGLDVPLLEGLARSSQIADTGAFFLGMGLMILTGLLSSRKVWFHAPAMLLVITALYRLIAWLIHHAAFAPQLIAIEVIIAIILIIAAQKLATRP
jgi:hypothetical protein